MARFVDPPDGQTARFDALPVDLQETVLDTARVLSQGEPHGMGNGAYGLVRDVLIDLVTPRPDAPDIAPRLLSRDADRKSLRRDEVVMAFLGRLVRVYGCELTLRDQ